MLNEIKINIDVKTNWKILSILKRDTKMAAS
jgi:hypothetical protein